jgi:hypothetical protein
VPSIRTLEGAPRGPTTDSGALSAAGRAGGELEPPVGAAAEELRSSALGLPAAMSRLGAAHVAGRDGRAETDRPAAQHELRPTLRRRRPTRSWRGCCAITASRALGLTAASRVLGASKRFEMCTAELAELGRLAGRGRGRRAWPCPPIGRCRWRGTVRAKRRHPCAALPARGSGARRVAGSMRRRALRPATKADPRRPATPQRYI